MSPSLIVRNFSINLNSSLRMFGGDIFFTMEILKFLRLKSESWVSFVSIDSAEFSTFSSSLKQLRCRWFVRGISFVRGSSSFAREFVAPMVLFIYFKKVQIPQLKNFFTPFISINYGYYLVRWAQKSSETRQQLLYNLLYTGFMKRIR